jgi:hypothetical protein
MMEIVLSRRQQLASISIRFFCVSFVSSALEEFEPGMIASAQKRKGENSS